jgi:DNA-binding response OmpR family regulator
LHYLIELLKKQRMPPDAPKDEGTTKILFASEDQDLIANLKRTFLVAGGFEILAAVSESDARAQAEGLALDCVVVDFATGQSEALWTCERLRRDSKFAQAVFVAILPEGARELDFARLRLDDVFTKPFDTALLAERLRRLTAERAKRA